MAGHQQITRDWWQKRRPVFHVVASQLVMQEARSGDEKAARYRLELAEGLELLEVNEESLELAQALVERGPLPLTAAGDALHIAISVTNGVEYLLTWNCKHLANASMRTAIDNLCRSEGYEPSIICTPEELMED